MIEAASGRRRPIVVATIATAAAVAGAIGVAASRGLAAEPDAVPSSHIEYLPSISDLMIATIQPRHEWLWRAAQAGDWEFAANWLTHTPPALVAQHLNVDEATTAEWPDNGPGVMPEA